MTFGLMVALSGSLPPTGAPRPVGSRFPLLLAFSWEKGNDHQSGNLIRNFFSVEHLRYYLEKTTWIGVKPLSTSQGNDDFQITDCYIGDRLQ